MFLLLSRFLLIFLFHGSNLIRCSGIVALVILVWKLLGLLSLRIMLLVFSVTAASPVIAVLLALSAKVLSVHILFQSKGLRRWANYCIWISVGPTPSKDLMANAISIMFSTISLILDLLLAFVRRVTLFPTIWQLRLFWSVLVGLKCLLFVVVVN